MDYLIALGSNRAKAHLTCYDVLSYAIWLIGGRSMTVSAQSRFITAPAMPAGSGPDYLRVALRLKSDLGPVRVAAVLDQVETALVGLESPEVQLSGCILETDILACGDQVLPTDFDWRRRQKDDVAPGGDLVLPHPELHESPAFVTMLMDIAPDWTHPVLRKTVSEMLSALPSGRFAEIREPDAAGEERDVAE